MKEDRADCAGKESEEIGRYMKTLLQQYDSIRGKNPKDLGIPFWDLVVISAGDPSQEAWYLAQLGLKAEQGDIPTGIEYLCISDPPGPRIGSGGATINILKELREKYGEEVLYSWRVLIIHAGGYSKRLPSHSCSGKIFSPLPILPTAGGPYQMLDLKLALYLPFITAMEAGVFITASDDIEVLNIDLIPKTDKGEVITALAHPSSLFIGSTHGVYVTNKQNRENETQPLVEVSDCLEVLQKPTEALMEDRGAVTQDRGQKQVYSDSAFWFHTPTTKKLIKLHDTLFPLSSELCIYGDLLTLLGTRQDKHFIQALHSKDQSCDRVSMVRALETALGDTPLQVIKLHSSKFYHLGTCQEYLQELTQNTQLKTELNLSNIICSKIVCESGGNSVGNGSATNGEPTTAGVTANARATSIVTSNGSATAGDSSVDDVESLIRGVLLCSSVVRGTDLPSNSIVEYSILHSKVAIGQGTILSNVCVGCDITRIPDGFLFHTVPIRRENRKMFVTIGFRIEDDIKLSTCRSRMGELQFGGSSLGNLFKISSSHRPEIVFPGSDDPASLCSGPVSLWSARLFPACGSMEASLRATVSLLEALASCQTVGEDGLYAILVSMEDLIQEKDGDGILQFRKHLSYICKK